MSGIYIPSMEMPTKKEGVAVLICPDGKTVVEPFDIGFSQYGEAIPVPDHGDLIERDALRGKVTEVAIRKWNGSHFTTQILRVIPEEALLTAPAVIQRETEKGVLDDTDDATA